MKEIARILSILCVLAIISVIPLADASTQESSETPAIQQISDPTAKQVVTKPISPILQVTTQPVLDPRIKQVTPALIYRRGPIITTVKPYPIYTKPGKKENKDTNTRSGGGGGGSSCTNWNCEEWSQCSDGKQSRKCIPQESCQAAEQIITRSCIPDKSQPCKDGERKCNGPDLNECKDGKWTTLKCKEGCNEAKCIQVVQEQEEPKKEIVLQSETKEEEPRRKDLSITGLISRIPGASIFTIMVTVVLFLGALIYWKASN